MWTCATREKTKEHEWTQDDNNKTDMKLTENKLRSIIRKELQKLNEKPKHNYKKGSHEYKVASNELREFMENLADYLGIKWETKSEGRTIFAKKKIEKKLDDNFFLSKVNINMRPRAEIEIKFNNGHDDFFSDEHSRAHLFTDDWNLPMKAKVDTTMLSDKKPLESFEISSPRDARKFYEKGKKLAKKVIEQN